MVEEAAVKVLNHFRMMLNHARNGLLMLLNHVRNGLHLNHVRNGLLMLLNYGQFGLGATAVAEAEEDSVEAMEEAEEDSAEAVEEAEEEAVALVIPTNHNRMMFLMTYEGVVVVDLLRALAVVILHLNILDLSHFSESTKSNLIQLVFCLGIVALVKSSLALHQSLDIQHYISKLVFPCDFLDRLKHYQIR